MTPLKCVEILLALSIQVAVIVAVSQLFARFLCRSDLSRDRVWSGCLITLLVVVLADFSFPHLRVLPVPASLGAPTLDVSGEQRFPFAGWLVVTWAAGAALALARLILGIAVSLSAVRRATPVSMTGLPLLLDRACIPAHRDNVGAPHEQAQLFLTAAHTSPFCWHMHRAKIVLPEFVLRMPDEEAAAVIRHEQAHVALGHSFWLLIQRFVEAALWFHPSAWFASRRANEAREFACDALAAPDQLSARSLLCALLRLAEVKRSHPRASLASLAVGNTPGLLARRARRLSDLDSSARGRDKRAPLWPLLAATAVAAHLVLWIPLDAGASARSRWSPWPTWSAQALHAVGISVRDYEIDSHRLRPHHPHS